MTNAKKQGQRLIPEYLLKYTEKLENKHPDPEADWGGGGGSEYSAGTGIDITGSTISIDVATVATKNDLNSYILNNDLSYTPEFRGQGVYVKGDSGAAYTTTIYGDGSISRSIPRTPGYTYTLPSASGTLALTSDIPDVSEFVTQTTLTAELANYVPSSSITTVAYTGSYNDLTDKPSIPDDYVDLSSNQTIGGVKEFTSSITGPRLVNDTTLRQRGIDLSSSHLALNKGRGGIVVGGYPSSTYNPERSGNTGGILLVVDDNAGFLDTRVGWQFEKEAMYSNGISANLGTSYCKFNNLYLTGNITDGTASVAVSDLASATTVTAQLATKQDALVSGTNIKTINNQSVLGSGNINISGGSSYTAGEGININGTTISVDVNTLTSYEELTFVYQDNTTATFKFIVRN